MQIWIHDNKMKKIVALNNDISDMLSYTNSTWHSYLDQATSTFDFTIPKFSNGELHEDLKLINDECFVSFYVNGSYQVFYIATLQEDDFNIQLTCNNTNLEYALEYANPFSADGAQTIEWYLNHMDLLSFAAVEIGINEISDRKRTLTFDSQETKMNRLQSLMSKFEAEFEFKVELNRDGTYKRIVINIYQEADDTHHGIGTDRKDVVLYYSNGLKGVQVTSDKTQMFNAGVFDGKDGVNLANVEFSEKNADGVEEFYSRKGDIFVYAPLSMQRYPATMKPDGQDNWIRKDFTTEYENVNDLKAYALRTLKKYAYPLVTYTASVQSGFVSHYTDLKLGDTIRIIDKNFVGGLALEARVSEMIISFDNPANNSFVFTNYRKLDNKPSSALQTRIEQAVESKLPYRIELATTGGVTFKNNEGETIIKPSLYKGNLPWTKDVTWRWALDGVVTVGMQYLARAENIDGTAVLTVSAYVGNNEVATTEITLTDVNDGDDGVGVESIDRYFTSSDQSDGVTIEGAEWSDKPPAPTEDGKYLWAYDEITYTDGTVTTTEPAAVGSNFDVDAFRAEIAEELKDVPNREEFENKIAEELATSKAEIETQIETAKTQAESNAKEYADTINQETANVAELANAAAGEIKADLVNVKNNLTATSLVANNAQAAVDAAKQELTEVASELNTAKQDLTNSVAEVNAKVNNTKEELTQAKQDLVSQAQQLQEQAGAQSELSNRVSSVEKTANGTKTTVGELSKTVAQNGKDITSVTARTKTVEDDLAGTKSTLSQVQTTANSTSQKTATLESGLDGLSAKFDSLKVGSVNLLKNSKSFTGSNITGVSTILNETYQGCVVRYFKNTNPNSNYQDLANFLSCVVPKSEGDYVASFWAKGSGTVSVFFYNGLIVDSFVTSQGVSGIIGDGRATFTLSENWERYWVKYKLQEITEQQTVAKNLLLRHDNNRTEDEIWLAGVQLEEGNIPTDYSPNEADIEQKVAEYKQTADQNYVSLQSTVQNLDGTVTANKATADQTAAGFKTRIESLETYKDGESERANAYFESAKTETAKQLTAERTAIAKDYVAKSTYTSDVTGIRNELSATTSTANATKTNLANYQASNDKMVASLKSSLQTTDGNVSNLQTKVEAVPGQITSAVSSVEGKIPTEMGSSNLLRNTAVNTDNLKLFGKSNSTISVVTKDGHQTYKIIVSANGSGVFFNGNDTYYNLIKDRTYTFSFWVLTNKDKSYGFNSLGHIQAINQNGDAVGSDILHQHTTPVYSTDNIKANIWTKVWCTFKATSNSYFKPYYWYLKAGDEIYIYDMMLNEGKIPLSYAPAVEDTQSDITKLNTTLTQTSDGLKQLSTQVTSQGSTITSHTNSINSLTTGLNAKVSQTDFNTLSGRVTTAENNITAKANELTSKITGVEGKIPSGEMNLVEYGRPADGYSPYNNAQYTTHSFYYNGAYKMYILRNTNTRKIFLNLNRFKVERNTDYTLYFKGFNNTLLDTAEVYFLKRKKGSTSEYDEPQRLLKRKLLAGAAEEIIVTFNAGEYDEGYLRFDNNGTTTAGTSADLYFGDVSVKKGKSNNGWSPSLAELASSQDLKTAQSEIKQTTDSIKASVSSLDQSTVKSSSLTINADGIVMKAGKSTTDVANAIGSYFAVNQNAINLFSDKINVKGNMIVNGAITSDKIASKSINTAHLNGKIITADVISSNAVTAGAIKAGAVTTDKMSANSINGDRIAAGTLDAAKIKAGSITASQIASGTITSNQIKAGGISSANIAAGAITGDKIKANSVDVSKIVGIDADYIKAKIEYAMIDWLKGKTITAYNDNMTIDLQDGRISFKDGSNAVYRQTPDGIHTGFLHFEAGSQGGIYAAFGATSTRQGINSKSSEFAGIRCYRVSENGDSHEAKIDKIEVIGDTIQFGHGYRSDGSIGGGFIIDAAAYANETPYSLNRVIKSIEALWRILHDHAKNTGYRFDDSAFISALNNEYNAWHDMHND